MQSKSASRKKKNASKPRAGSLKKNDNRVIKLIDYISIFMCVYI